MFMGHDVIIVTSHGIANNVANTFRTAAIPGGCKEAIESFRQRVVD